MAKVLRSIRIDDSVFDYIERFNALRSSAGLSRVPIGDVIQDSVRFYVADQAVSLKAMALQQLQGIESLSADVSPDS